MKKICLLSFSLLLAGICLAQTYTVDNVPNDKLINNSYVSNPDRILSEATVNGINGVLSSLEKQTTVQVAVVVIQSIGRDDIFEFAQKLFDKWGIGQAGKDNGLLILLVYDQRTIRFHTGYGLEGVLTDIMCKRIQMERMVPQFKIDDYDAGMIAGVEEIAYVLSNPAYADELRDDAIKSSNGWNTFFIVALIAGGVVFLIWFLILNTSGSFADSRKKKQEDPYSEMRLKRVEWVIMFGIIPIGLLLLFNSMSIDTDNHILVFLLLIYSYFIITLLLKRIRMRKVVNRLTVDKNFRGTVEFFIQYQGFWLFSAIVFPVPMIFLFLQYLSRKKHFRNHPRNCKSCGNPLHKQDEKTDDQYLKKEQVKEEELSSVDYDVWLCSSCQSKEILNYVNRFSKYSPCPRCKTKAYFKESDVTLQSPTYSSSGKGQITRRCKFCSYVGTETYSIAKLTSSSSSGGSGGGSGGGGGSWGGGSSGGGGASSSW